MAAFLNVCRFNPTAGGTGDFVVSSAVTGYHTPASAGAVTGLTYRYRAESTDLTQWEVGYGVYTSGTTTLARTTVIQNSAGDTSKISFSAAPQVAIVALKEDLLEVGGDAFALAGGKIVASVAANALTIAVKTNAGNDPSAGEPVHVTFRSATAADGAYTVITLTGANSFTISSGSTMAFTANEASRLWIGGFNDSGTFRLAASKRITSTGGTFPLDDEVVLSSTAEGGAGGADSSGIIYTGTAVTSKPFRLLGYLEWTSGLATPGTWGTNADVWVPFGPGVKKPGDVVQVQFSSSGVVATGTTTIPVDDTIPQNTEGTEFLTRAITPSSKANLLIIEASLYLSNSSTGQMVAALFQDSTANALSAMVLGFRTADDSIVIIVSYTMIAGTSGATTFKARAGMNNAGTTTFNGFGGVRKMGGVAGSYIRITEYQG